METIWAVIVWLASFITLGAIVYFWEKIKTILRAIKLGLTERNWINRAVQLLHVEIEKVKLTDPDPQLVFHFYGINAAMSSISFENVIGAGIQFNGKELPGQIRLEMGGSSPNPIARLARFQIDLKQSLTKEQAERILGTPQEGNLHVNFGFRKVRIQFMIFDDRKRTKPPLFEKELPENLQVHAIGVWPIQHGLNAL